MQPLLEIQDLSVSFSARGQRVRAVQNVSYELRAGETLGLVGESGSGKTVSSLALMGLIPQPPGRIDSGSVRFEGKELLGLPARQLRRIRGKRIAMIFQDPMTSLNPLLSIGRQLTEVLEVHLGLGRREARRRAAKKLGEVGIADPEARLDAYPHELSGGMRQRVMIAMALLCDPALILADEPTTALDVTIQAQILELLREQQERHGMALLLITHDLGVVAGMADRVNVMYAGRLVESGSTRELFRAPLHPYTQGLLASVPSLAHDPGERLFSIEGVPPDLSALPAGCAFAARCEQRLERCTDERPELQPEDPTGSPERQAACHLLDEGRRAAAQGGQA